MYNLGYKRLPGKANFCQQTIWGIWNGTDPYQHQMCASSMKNISKMKWNRAPVPAPTKMKRGRHVLLLRYIYIYYILLLFLQRQVSSIWVSSQTWGHPKVSPCSDAEWCQGRCCSSNLCCKPQWQLIHESDRTCFGFALALLNEWNSNENRKHVWNNLWCRLLNIGPHGFILPLAHLILECRTSFPWRGPLIRVNKPLL